MSNFCRYCGRDLVNGECSCAEFQAGMRLEKKELYDKSYYKDPFFIQQMKLDFTSASSVLTSFRNQAGVAEDGGHHANPYERDMPIVPACIEPEENEIVVKQYDIAKLRTRLKFMKAEGRLQVTNRRVLFRAAGTSLTGNILQEHQFNLDEIGGIEMHKDYKFSILSFLGCYAVNALALTAVKMLLAKTGSNSTFIIGLILGIVGLVPTFVVYKRFGLKLFAAVIASSALGLAVLAAKSDGARTLTGFLLLVAELIYLINVIIICFVPNLVIKIKTKGATGAVVIGSQKTMFRRKSGDDYSGFVEVMPWKDTFMAMNELGTMIDDLQKHGDYAIEKWSR